MDETGVVNAFCAIAFAALSIWDYPQRQPRHEILQAGFIAAVSSGDSVSMEKISREGTVLLPEDPTWRYNLACALAKNGRRDEALDELDKAVRLGHRDTVGIRNDADFASVSSLPRFDEILELSERLEGMPLTSGPYASVPATAVAGKPVILGSHNLSWNYQIGAFEVKMSLAGAKTVGNSGDLYFNRDAGHSVLDISKFPGTTRVTLDQEGRSKGAGLDFPDMLFPYPVFGNCSRALVAGPVWRSLPRAMMTSEARRMKAAHAFYRSNQIWVFPAVYDCPPAGTNGDVFASVCPYWIQTEGKSWSDLPYLEAALEVSRSLKGDVKKAAVSHGLLAPVVQTILRKSLRGVEGEEDYLSPKAHPTAFPAGAVDIARLKKLSAELTVASIPPVVTLSRLGGIKPPAAGRVPETTYFTPCAAAFVLRGGERKREFILSVSGAEEYGFAIVHGREGAARLERIGPDAVRITLDKDFMDPAHRVDVAAFGRNKGTRWGAPAFVSFAAMDASAPYSDPVLTEKEQTE